VACPTWRSAPADPSLFRQTARRIAGARLRLYPRKGHFGTVTYRPAIDEILEFLTSGNERRAGYS
jgi:hypothetical protein